MYVYLQSITVNNVSIIKHFMGFLFINLSLRCSFSAPFTHRQAILHYAPHIIWRLVQGVKFVKIMSADTLFYIFHMNSNVLVSVAPCLLMMKPQSMHHLV